MFSSKRHGVWVNKSARPSQQLCSIQRTLSSPCEVDVFILAKNDSLLQHGHSKGDSSIRSTLDSDLWGYTGLDKYLSLLGQAETVPSEYFFDLLHDYEQPMILWMGVDHQRISYNAPKRRMLYHNGQ